MNDDDQLHQLRQATSRASNDTPLPIDSEAPETDDLRDAWRRMTDGLREQDGKLKTDHADFASRVLASLEGLETVPADVRPSVRKAAILPSGEFDSRPATRQDWLALIAIVAVCGLAIWWFDGSKESSPANETAEVVQTEPRPAADPSTRTNAPLEVASPTHPNATIADEPPHLANSAETFSANWTDPVDDAIAEASEQLVAMHGSSNWDRSVQAFEQYRQSVEQEMNDWAL